jgi:uncharacterized protein YndB with AHSA1/START domain
MTMTTTNTDRIEKNVLLHAPKARVWRALTDASEFGSWFGVKLESGFAVGQSAAGQITNPGYEHLTMRVEVERMEAEKLFSFRWHPNATDPKKDYSAEPATLVEFRLEETAEGTLLTVVESGFDQLPPERRADAFRGNSAGWAQQVERIKRHVGG